MSNQANDPSGKQVPLRDIKMESGSEDLLDSPAMEPYVNLALAVMGGKDPIPRMLPLIQKYYVRSAPVAGSTSRFMILSAMRP